MLKTASISELFQILDLVINHVCYTSSKVLDKGSIPESFQIEHFIITGVISFSLLVLLTEQIDPASSPYMQKLQSTETVDSPIGNCMAENDC